MGLLKLFGELFGLVSKKKFDVEINSIREAFGKYNSALLDTQNRVVANSSAIASNTSALASGLTMREVSWFVREQIAELRGAGLGTSGNGSGSSVSPPVVSGVSVSPMRKKVEKALSRAEILEVLRGFVASGYTTTSMFNEVVLVRGLCGKTAFYKYLKEVKVRELRVEHGGV